MGRKDCQDDKKFFIGVYQVMMSFSLNSWYHKLEMKLQDIGYNEELEKFRLANHLEGLEVGRIVSEHKERYVVMTAEGEWEAEVTGNLRFTAKSREDFPAVGDWVALSTEDSGFSVIHTILPRFSILQRKAVGKFGEIQVIATNIDYAFLVQAVDRDFNINRLERYLVLCYSAKVSPIIVLSKTDLIDKIQLDTLLSRVRTRIKDVPVIPINNQTPDGLNALKNFIKKGKTYCLLGSSGAGKSTLVNHLFGKTIMKTDAISGSTKKGKHKTSHRELVILESGGILIDNPGMREVGIADTVTGLGITFDKVVKLSQKCKFTDCTHTKEPGCRVLEALNKGEIDQSAYENYLKLLREQANFEVSVAERRKKDKEFGKIVKNYKKDIRRNQNLD